jgi:hypothetical protein
MKAKALAKAPVVAPMRNPISMRRVVRTWWPLAASWLLMASEQPVLSAIVARLAEPEINLAAWGGLVFPLALIIESPIIMLLSASTALSKDWDSYLRLRRFMMWAGVLLTVLHVLIVFTPLYYVVAVGLVGAPAEIVEPARLGLMIMPPWAWAIAYRRFNQGVLIRFGHSRAVGIGTLVRLSADGLVLAIGYLTGTVPGIVVAAGAVTCGVVSEAIYAAWRVRPVLRDQVRSAVPVERALTFRAFLRFYIPLAMTSLLYLIVQPIGSAALSRMPNALESLAVWPVVYGLLLVLRSLGIAYTEVVVALLDEPRAMVQLRRFAVALTALTTGVMLIMVATPLATFWFQRVSALALRLATLAQWGLWIALPLPGLTVLQSWYQGIIVHSSRTRGVTEAMVIFLLVSCATLWAGVVWARVSGLYVGLTAFSTGVLLQTAWLWQRSRPVRLAG